MEEVLAKESITNDSDADNGGGNNDGNEGTVTMGAGNGSRNSWHTTRRR